MKLNKRKLLTISLSLLVVACGGGNTNVTTVVPVDINNQTLINEPQGITPFFIRDEPSNTHQEPNQKDTWSFAVRHQGADIVSKEVENTNEIIKKTGVDFSQLNVIKGNGRGSFFGSYNNSFSSYIDTSSSPYETVIGGGPHSVVGYEFSVQPSVIGTTIKADFAIPLLETKGDSVGQLSIIGYMNDGKSTVAFVFPLLDNRYNTFTPYVMSDTYVSFASQPINATKYANPYSNESMVKTPYVGYKTYGVTFTEDGLKNMINDLNKFNSKNNITLISTNPSDYKLNLVGILHEVFLMNNSTNEIKSGVSFKNINVFK